MRKEKKLEIEKLRNELFNEEAKLIVMQKIKALNSNNSVSCLKTVWVVDLIVYFSASKKWNVLKTIQYWRIFNLAL